MAVLHNTNYDPKYPWRPAYFWDKCPSCFENFDMDFKCDHCGSGHKDQDRKASEQVPDNAVVNG